MKNVCNKVSNRACGFVFGKGAARCCLHRTTIMRYRMFKKVNLRLKGLDHGFSDCQCNTAQKLIKFYVKGVYLQ